MVGITNGLLEEISCDYGNGFTYLDIMHILIKDEHYMTIIPPLFLY